MLKIGLTGGIGTGKSTVAALFAELGITIIDADQVSRELTRPSTDTLSEIVAHFGPGILNPDQSLNRQHLRKIIFENADEKQWLEQLMHPRIRARMQNAIDNATSPYCILVIPLLLESGPKHPLVDRVLVVDAPPALQIARAQARDQQTEQDIAAIIATQVSREERRARADDLIENDGDLASLKEKVYALHDFYCNHSASRT